MRSDLGGFNLLKQHGAVYGQKKTLHVVAPENGGRIRLAEAPSSSWSRGYIHMGTSQISFAKILYKRPTRQKPRTCVARSEVRVWHGPKTCRNRNSMNCCIFIGSRAWHMMLATNGNNWESHCIYTIFNVIRLCQLTILIGCASPFIACSHFLMLWNFISWLERILILHCE